jgi:hypothetical protein
MAEKQTVNILTIHTTLPLIISATVTSKYVQYMELQNVCLRYSCILGSELEKIKETSFTINVKINDDLYQTQYISNGSKISNPFFYRRHRIQK